MKKEFTAWAINSRSDEGHGYLGRYWGFQYSSQNIPSHMHGCRIALFDKRALARAEVEAMKAKAYVLFPNARVEKVTVTIESSRGKKVKK